MDPSAFVPWISSIIAGVITYINTQGIQKASDRAAEVIGEKFAETATHRGQKALALLHSKFFEKADTQAIKALSNVEQDPDNEDYQQQLIKEAVRLASTDAAFVQELKVLAENISTAPQLGNVAIDNKASNQGAQGIFYSPVQFGIRDTRDIEDDSI